MKEFTQQDRQDIYQNLTPAVAEFLQNGAVGEILLLAENGDLAKDKNYMQRYCGIYKSKIDFVRHFLTMNFYLPPDIQHLINYRQLASELFVNDFFAVTVDKYTHVFVRDSADPLPLKLRILQKVFRRESFY